MCYYMAEYSVILEQVTVRYSMMEIFGLEGFKTFYLLTVDCKVFKNIYMDFTFKKLNKKLQIRLGGTCLKSQNLQRSRIGGLWLTSTTYQVQDSFRCMRFLS